MTDDTAAEKLAKLHRKSECQFEWAPGFQRQLGQQGRKKLLSLVRAANKENKAKCETILSSEPFFSNISRLPYFHVDELWYLAWKLSSHFPHFWDQALKIQESYGHIPNKRSYSYKSKHNEKTLIQNHKEKSHINDSTPISNNDPSCNDDSTQHTNPLQNAAINESSSPTLTKQVPLDHHTPHNYTTNLNSIFNDQINIRRKSTKFPKFNSKFRKVERTDSKSKKTSSISKKVQKKYFANSNINFQHSIDKNKKDVDITINTICPETEMENITPSERNFKDFPLSTSLEGFENISHCLNLQDNYNQIGGNIKQKESNTIPSSKLKTLEQFVDKINKSGDEHEDESFSNKSSTISHSKLVFNPATSFEDEENIYKRIDEQSNSLNNNNQTTDKISDNPLKVTHIKSQEQLLDFASHNTNPSIIDVRQCLPQNLHNQPFYLICNSDNEARLIPFVNFLSIFTYFYPNYIATQLLTGTN